MAESGNAAVDRGNLVVIGAMSMLWISPVILFWGAVFGPLRPYDYPDADVAPAPLPFLIGVAVCLAPCLLGERWYACPEGRRGTRMMEALGIRTFRRFATSGDLINRWGRRTDPAYRTPETASVEAFVAGTRSGERAHLVLLLAGILTAIYAARIGWFGWAGGITAGNLVFNLYPVLLQRYNRCRMLAVRARWNRSSSTDR